MKKYLILIALMGICYSDLETQEANKAFGASVDQANEACKKDSGSQQCAADATESAGEGVIDVGENVGDVLEDDFLR